jgi:basic membrane protein A
MVALGSVLVVALASPVVAAPEPAKVPTSAPLIGLVSDIGSLYDRSYNQYAWEGVQAGAEAIGGDAVVMQPRTATDKDYAKNIKKLLNRGADVVVTVGFMAGNATIAAAVANPSVQFIGVDQGVPGPTPANYQGLVFAGAQSGYLAGIVAATLSESGTIGAVGGMDFIPPVLAYINGYRNGAISVDPTGETLVTYTGDFSSPDLGAQAANGLIDAGADVVFGVAGMTNVGVLQATCDRGVWGIGVDVDQSLQLPAFGDCILTSAEYRIETATAGAIVRWFDGQPDFQSGTFLNDASNDGIGIAPIRNVTPSAELLAALDAAYAGMAAGTLDPCSPTTCDTP